MGKERLFNGILNCVLHLKMLSRNAEIDFCFERKDIKVLVLYLADQALWYLPIRRALSLAKYGAWNLSHMDDAVMAEFLMPPVIMPRGRLHM